MITDQIINTLSALLRAVHDKHNYIGSEVRCQFLLRSLVQVVNRRGCLSGGSDVFWLFYPCTVLRRVIPCAEASVMFTAGAYGYSMA
jgi:hypothetical protein